MIGRPPNNLKTLENVEGQAFEDYYAGNEYLQKLHDELIIAADFTDMTLNGTGDDFGNTAIAMFSPGHYHSAPLSLKLMFNTILRYEFPGRDYSVEMSGSSMSHKRQVGG